MRTGKLVRMKPDVLLEAILNEILICLGQRRSNLQKRVLTFYLVLSDIDEGTRGDHIGREVENHLDDSSAFP